MGRFPVIVFLGNNRPAEPFDDDRIVPVLSDFFCDVLFNTLRKGSGISLCVKKYLLAFKFLLVQKIRLCRRDSHNLIISLDFFLP